MALKLGELFVQLGVRGGQFGAAMEEAAGVVEKTAKKIKAVSNDLAEFGGMAGAAVGALVAVAAGANRGVAQEVERLKKTFNLLAVDVARAMLPLITSLREFVASVVQAWRGASPATKALVRDFVQVGAVGGVAFMALGKGAKLLATLAEGAGMVGKALAFTAPAMGRMAASVVSFAASPVQKISSGLGGALSSAALSMDKFAAASKAATTGPTAAKGFTGLIDGIKAFKASALNALPAIWSMAVPLLTIIAIAVAVALVAGTIYKAWNENLGGIRDKASAVWQWMGDAIGKLGNWIMDIWDDVRESLGKAWDWVGKKTEKLINALWDVFTAFKRFLIGWIKSQAQSIASFFGLFGIDTSGLMANLDEALAVIDEGLSRESLTAGLNAGVQMAVGMGIGLKKAGKFALDGTKELGRDVGKGVMSGIGDMGDWLKGKLGLGNGGPNVGPNPKSFYFRSAQEITPLVRQDENLGSALQRRHINGGQLPDWAKDLTTLTLNNEKGFARVMFELEKVQDLNPAIMEFLKAYRSEFEDQDKLTKELKAARAAGTVTGKLNTSGPAGAVMSRGVSAGYAAVTAAADQSAKSIKNALLGAAQTLVSKLGDLGGLIDTALSALATGGPFAAIAAVGADLLSQSVQFGQLVEMVNGLLHIVADALGKLVAPLTPLVAVLGMLVDTVMNALSPVLGIVAQVLAGLAPIFVILSDTLVALAPVIQIAVAMFMAITNPLLALSGPVLQGLFYVIKFTAVSILKVVRLIAPIINGLIKFVAFIIDTIGGGINVFMNAVAGIWNGIISAIQAVFRKLGDISVLGKHPLGFLNDWAKDLEKAKMPTDILEGMLDGLAESVRNGTIDLDALTSKIQELEGLSLEQAQAKAQETVEIIKAREAQRAQTDAVKEATAALTNVPQGYKIATARFASMAITAGAVAMAAGAATSVAAAATPAPVAQAAAVAQPNQNGIMAAPSQSAAAPAPAQVDSGDRIVEVHIHGVTDPAEQWRKIKPYMDRDTWKNKGVIP